MSTPRAQWLRTDLPWLALVLAFFAFQYRHVVLLGRHWLFEDNASFNFPVHFFVWDRVRHGGLTQPCLEMALGFPLLSEPQVQAFYPLNTAWWPIGDPYASFTLKLLLHMLAATIGLYVLARQLGRSPMASAAAAVALCGSSFMVARIVHAPLLFSLAWLPWIVTLFLRARLGGSRLAVVGLVGACAMQILTGHPQLTIYTIVVALVVAWARRAGDDGQTTLQWWGRSLGMVIGAYAGGMVVAMVQVGPTYELYLYGSRTGAAEQGLVRQWGCTLRDLAADFLARAEVPLKWEKTAFPGSLAWAAVLLALWRRDRLSLGLLALVGLGLFLSWSDGNPAYDVIAYLPILNKLRGSGRIGILIVIGGALLLARMLDDLRDKPARRPFLAVVGALALLEAVGLVTTGRLGVGPLAADDPLSWQVPVLLAALIAMGAARLWPRLKVGLAPALLVFVMVELAALGVTTQPALTKEQWLATDDQRIYQVAEEHAARKPGAFVRWRDGLASNVAILHHLPQTRCYTPMVSDELETYNTIFFGPNRANVLAAFGVRWVATTPELARQENLRPVTQVGKWLLCENPLPSPRAYIPHELVPGDFVTGIELLSDPRTDPVRTTVVPTAAIGPQPVYCPKGQVEVLEDKPGHMVVRTRTTAPGVVVVTRLATPHWTATLDGQSIPTTTAYFHLLAAPTAPGEHTVAFDYHMPLLRPALVSLLAVLGWCVWLGVELRRRRIASAG